MLTSPRSTNSPVDTSMARDGRMVASAQIINAVRM
jgi:hypothetical protein